MCQCPREDDLVARMGKFRGGQGREIRAAAVRHGTRQGRPEPCGPAAACFQGRVAAHRHAALVSLNPSHGQRAARDGRLRGAAPGQSGDTAARGGRVPD
jgi:hypothetical protein